MVQFTPSSAVVRLLVLAAMSIAGLQAAAIYVAERLSAVVGPSAPSVPPPWAFLTWRAQYGAEHPQVFASGLSLILLGAAIGVLLIRLFEGGAIRASRKRGWADLAEARRAGLLEEAGCVIGELRGRLITTDDLRPTLVTGGTRSGKGRGHVLPSLLSWTGSALVHDPKGELWRETAGWRASFSHALFLDPRSPASARFNPLAEIGPGPQAVAEVQRLVAILADPAGVRDTEAIWDKAASEILEAVILHVLHTAADADKNLVTVRRLLADLDGTAETMLRAHHRKNGRGEPECHPFIQVAAQGYAAMHDRFRTSVQGTARGYLKWLSGEDVERTLSASDFRLGDLMCAEAPMSLYVRVAPADAAALRPLIRLMFYAASQALTVDEACDSAGRPKRHRLLMMMDEFPLLGRIEFFTKSLRLLSGYGVKCMFAAQSLNDIAETYGVQNTILDNCHVYTAFAALDPLTQDRVSKLTGSVSEPRESVSRSADFAGSGRRSVTRSEQDRPLLEPGEIRGLSDDEQLTFVAGHRPFRLRKVRYDQREPFRSRAALPPPDQTLRVDAPSRPVHPWAGLRGYGEDEAMTMPLFPEARAMVAEREAKAAVERAETAAAKADAALEALRMGR